MTSSGRTLLLHGCRLLDNCPSGSIRMTRAHLLPARNVIHSVRTICGGGNPRYSDRLGNRYERCLFFVENDGVASMSFPVNSPP
ncbi:MAG: macro domain-containing protein [Pseudomonadota bacterium]|nr:macro domain-containing protein [Pseudomonadota bacterium]